MGRIKMNLGAIVVTLLLALGSAQECDPKTGVCDKDERCSQWKEEGDCSRRPFFVKRRCPVSCGVREESIESDSSDTNCTDQHERCHIWARLGECRSNREDMEKYCAKSCGCGTGKPVKVQADEFCRDKDNRCDSWAKSGECSNNPSYMHKNCAKSCKTCAEPTAEASLESEEEDDDDDDDNDDDNDVKSLLDRTADFGVRQTVRGQDDGHRTLILQRVRQTLSYLEENKVAQLPPKIRRSCKNAHELCSFWAAVGECHKNSGYMNKNCSAACFSCKLNMLTMGECMKQKDAIPSFFPGGVNQLFHRLAHTAPGNRTQLTNEEDVCVTEVHPDMPPYTIHVHSRPSEEPSVEVSALQDKTLPPWLISLDDFFTEEECDDMIQLGINLGFKSTMSEEQALDTVACSESCRNEDLPKRLHERISRLLETPVQNSENFEFLKCSQGQFQSQRHDYDPLQKELSCGPRILTLFAFLSNEGGGVQFPKLKNSTVQPKKGRVVIWPNVLDSNPSAKNARMEYRQTLASENEGVQFVAIVRIHLYDWLSPVLSGCIY